MTTRDTHPSFKSPAPACPHCGLRLPSSKPRVQVEGRWYCPDGWYLAEHPEAKLIPRVRRPKEPQAERLPQRQAGGYP